MHISDLHITKDGRPSAPDGRKDLRAVRQAVTEDQAEKFLEDLGRFIKANPTSRKMDAVIVSGDLVDSGGADEGEFRRAQRFLRELADKLDIRAKRVYVVPGNHDVNWSASNQVDRFKGYAEAVAEFTSPTVDADQPRARWDVTSFTQDPDQGIKAHLLLLVSPFFSGMADPSLEPLLSRIHEATVDLGLEEKRKIVAALVDARGVLDFGAITAHQRAEITSDAYKDDPSVVRIAVLHHHLLPHPRVELKPFEAVIDAGQTLKDLIDRGFDLVLTGHKHHRQLVQYRRGERALDVYTAPSLFEGTDPGFTIIDIHGGNEPCYAQLRHYSLECQELECHNLLRPGRVLPEITRTCAEIELEDQRTRLSPTIRALADAFKWRRQDAEVAELFEKVWSGQLAEELRKLGDRQLEFRQPDLEARWSELLGLAERRGKELRLVSDADLELWLDLENEDSYASKYSAPIHNFKGHKHRLLVIPFRELDKRKTADKWGRAIDFMLEHKIVVSIVNEDKVAGGDCDFGLIGDFAVSRFIGVGRESRVLQENFNPVEYKKSEARWNELLRWREWSSSSTRNFGSWLKSRPRS